MKKIIGLNLWSHDTSACLLQDKTLLGAIEQERLNGEKHTKEFPLDAIKLLLTQNYLSIEDVDEIAIGWDFNRLIQSQYLIPAITDINEGA